MHQATRKTVRALSARIGPAWCAETSACQDKWSKENPALGQCAATAALVREELGGVVVWALAELPDGTRESHYWNVVEGEEVDLTRDQFPPGTVVPTGGPRQPGVGDAYDYVMSYPATVSRVTLLLERAGLAPPASAPGLY
jgi:hypothetical protein